MARSLLNASNAVSSSMVAASTSSCVASYREKLAFLGHRNAAWSGSGALSYTVRKGGERWEGQSTKKCSPPAPAGIPARGAPRAGADPGFTPEKAKSSAFPKEDRQYLGKLFAGCAAGAGVIKYGSILFPQITQPSVVVAGIAVTAPVVASAVLLWAASSTTPPSSEI